MKTQNNFKRLLEQELIEGKLISKEKARLISADWAGGGDALQIFTTHGAKVKSEKHLKEIIEEIKGHISVIKKNPKSYEKTDIPNLQSLLIFVKSQK